MWIVTILAIIMGLFEIRYAYKWIEKDKLKLKRAFIIMGLTTIMLGLVLPLI
jgi:hypothetical protein